MSFRSIVQHPWKVVLISLGVVIGVGYFMKFVAPSVSYKDLLGADYPLLADYEHIQREFTHDDNLLVFVEAKSGDAFTKELLTGVQELTAALWRTPYSVRVDSVTNFQHSRATGDDLEVSDLVPTGDPLDATRLDEVRRIALAEPLLLNRVVNASGNVLAMNVSFAFPNENAEEKLAADGYVQELAAAFRKAHPEVNVYVGGLVSLDATVMAISTKETGLFLVLVMIIVVALMGILLRTFGPILASVFVFIFSIVASMALAGMMGWKLTPFTASVPMIVLIIAVADCVHLITTFTRRMSAGEEKLPALESALRQTFKPIVITSVTTAIGLMTLTFSESGGIRALGSQSAFGVLFACVLSVTFLPAALVLLPARVPSGRVPDAGRYAALAARLYRLRAPLLIGSAAVTILLGIGVTRNEFNDRIPTYFAESLPWRQANDFSEEQFGGAYTFSYALNSGQPGGVSDPEFLAGVERFAAWLKGLPEVAYVNSVTDTFKRLNKNMHGDDPEFYRLPSDRAEAAQYLLLYEMSLPYGLDLNDQINLDKSATKVLAAFQTMSTTQVLAMEQKVNAWLRQHLPGVKVKASGVQVMFAHLLNQDTRGLTMGAIYGLGVISLLLVFMLRSVKIGLVSVLPNLFPALFAFGAWGFFVGQVGMGLAMVSGMSIGIIVDDTVHFLTKYLKGRREAGMDAQQAVAYVYENVGPSIVFTTIVLVAGFLTMAVISEFRVNSDMGRMTAIIMLFALAFDLLVLPILLMMFDRAEVRVGAQKVAPAWEL